MNEANFSVSCGDGANGLLSLPEHSVKLVYGSPPYPNAVRNYGMWTTDEYIEKIGPFIDGAVHALRNDGFIVINVKANRERPSKTNMSERSLVIEELAIKMKKEWHLHCVDIEIWVKENPVPTGLRCACQDAYEQNLWFSVAPRWDVNLDAIRRPYVQHSKDLYESYEYKPRSNGVTYVRKNKKLHLNPLGALATNVITGGVSARKQDHQAVQPLYLPEKYIKACTQEGDLVADPWLGTGTTGVAALKLHRKFVGFDIYESYVDEARDQLSHCLEDS